MTPQVTAILLSAFAFPGCGHFYLKKNIVGAILLLLVLAGCYVLMSAAIVMAEAISIRLLNGDIPMEIMAIREAISAETAKSSTPEVVYATYLLVACWLLSIADCYRLGRVQKSM